MIDLIEYTYASALSRAARLNRDAGVISGTTIIGASSQNGARGKRRYSDAALRKIAAMAEGLPAYLNHVTPELAFKPRDVRDLIGVHRNVRYDPASRTVKSDLHLAEHQAPLVFSLAERFGDRIGHSLVSRGVIAMEGDTEVVQDVLMLRSADLVSDPATTHGLFESIRELGEQGTVHDRVARALLGEAVARRAHDLDGPRPICRPLAPQSWEEALAEAQRLPKGIHGIVASMLPGGGR